MLRTLIVDSDVVLTGLLRAVLESNGHSVTPCSSSVAAFAALRQGHDLIIIDPTVSGGWDVLTYVQLHPRLHHMPVIVCSSFPAVVQERQDWLQAHQVSTLIKPFSVAELRAQVKQALSRPLADTIAEQPAS